MWVAFIGGGGVKVKAAVKLHFRKVQIKELFYQADQRQRSRHHGQEPLTSVEADQKGADQSGKVRK